MKLLAQLLAIVSLAVLPSAAPAQAYPTKPVRMVIPFPPGGATDYVGRAVAQVLSDMWGQSVVPDNRAGAGSTIGTELVAKSVPDGYTILMGVNAGIVIAPHVYSKVGYDPLKDLIAITSFAISPQALVVTNALPVKTVEDLVALAKAKPGELLFASSGAGALPHLAAELFNSMHGIKAVHVPYKGSAPAWPDLISGRTHYMIDIIVNALPLAESGKLRLIAVTSSNRYPALPNVPTIAESGLPGYDVSQWYGLFAPVGTPGAVIRKIEHDVAKLMEMKALRENLSKRGAEMVYANSAQFTATVKKDFAKWEKVVKETGIKAE